jgi:hypothetical protein
MIIGLNVELCGKRENMNKYERWNKMSEEYFKNVTDEKLIKDSARVGIILVKREKTIRTAHKPSTARISRNFWKCTRANAAEFWVRREHDGNLIAVSASTKIRHGSHRKNSSRAIKMERHTFHR